MTVNQEMIDTGVAERVIKEATNRAHQRGDLLSYDDLYQELWVRWLKAGDLTGFEEPLLVWKFARMGRTVAKKARLEHMHATGGFVYTRGFVRVILADMVWASPDDVSDVDARADVVSALRQLDRSDREVLFKKYATQVRLSAAEAQKCLRAEDKITDWLNGETPVEVVTIDSYVQNMI